MKVFIVLTFLGCLYQSHAYPNGPPNGACGSMRPSHGAEPQATPAPFNITTDRRTYTRGDTITVTIDATNDTIPFRGFLIQARSPGSNNPIGQFIENDPEVQTMTCPGGQNNSISHNSRVNKTMKTFRWTNPAGSNVYFQGTFVNVQQIFWMNVRSETVRDVSPTTSGASWVKANAILVGLFSIAYLLA